MLISIALQLSAGQASDYWRFFRIASRRLQEGRTAGNARELDKGLNYQNRYSDQAAGSNGSSFVCLTKNVFAIWQQGWRCGLIKQFSHADFDSTNNGIKGQIVGGESEGFLDFIAERFQSEEGVGNKGDHQWCYPADRIDQAKGQ